MLSAISSILRLPIFQTNFQDWNSETQKVSSKEFMESFFPFHDKIIL